LPARRRDDSFGFYESNLSPETLLRQILLYRGKKPPHGAVFAIRQPYGKPEEETPAQDEQAQAPQALEVAPSPEAHVAEMSPLAFIATF